MVDDVQGLVDFQDSLEDSSTGTFEHRSLKYEKIANYKQNPVSIVRTTTVEDTKRPPIPPGGVLLTSLRISLGPVHLTDD